jgi:hypothetical protein
MVGEYKRVRGSGYTFVIPKEWVADTFVVLAKAQRQAGILDYQMKRNRGDTVIPDEGESGLHGELNLRRFWSYR